MNRKGLLIVILVLLLGSIAGLAYAKSGEGLRDSSLAVRMHDFYGSSLKYKGYLEPKNTEGFDGEMDEFMNNITDRDYKRMIEIMRENGFTEMADFMEQAGRKEMIRMHSTMVGAENCHYYLEGVTDEN